MNSKKDIGALCRIKVNKMLTSLNSNKNIFIPNYTLFNKNEEKYSYLNKTKGNSTKVNKNKKNLKDEMNINNIRTNEENYNNQPIDFIINHGILVYQRNFKGEEIINLGINNEYLKKNNFSMNKKDSTIYRTESNFRHKDNKNSDNTFNIYSKQSWSIKKKINTNGSKKTFVSTSDIPLSKNKNSSSRQKKILSTNLNTTQNSISSINSFSVKTFLVSSKNKNDNSQKKSVNENEKNNSNQKVKNTKRVINFIRKKKDSTNNQNKFLIFRKRKKKNSTFAGKEEKIK